MELNNTVLKEILKTQPEGNQKYIFLMVNPQLSDLLTVNGFHAMTVNNIPKFLEFISNSVLDAKANGYIFIVQNGGLKEVIKALSGCCTVLNAWQLFKDENKMLMNKEDIKPEIDNYLSQLEPKKAGNTEKEITAVELYFKDIPPMKWIVENIIPTGENMLVAAPKMNKSWFALSLSLAIAGGQPFLEQAVTQSGVLYYALEDSHRRLQDRMKKLLKGRQAPEHLYFMTEAKTLSEGFIEDLEKWLDRHKEVEFVVIDTLQKIRDITNNKNVYGSDYKDLAFLKKVADKRNIALLLIHHTRKLKDIDVYNNISGTNGIMGAVDTTIIFSKDKREDKKIKMDITGRDVFTNTYEIEFDDYEFKLLGTSEELKTQMADFHYRHNPIVKTIKALLAQYCSGWTGTAEDLKNEMLLKGFGYKDEKSIGKELKILQEDLYTRDNITYSYKRTGTGKRLHIFNNLLTLNDTTLNDPA